MAARLLPAQTFQDLIVWTKAHELVLRVFRSMKAFPKQETYGLCSQMKQAAVSVPGNIAEGSRRHGRANKIRFTNLAERSWEESRCYLILAQDIGYGSVVDLTALLAEVSRLLHAYSKAIQAAG